MGQNASLSKAYQLAPELRRCLLYCIVSVPLLAGVAVWVGQLRGQPIARGDAFSALFAACAIELALIVPLSWKLTSDGQGIARRRLWLWDSWSWDVFASGRVAKKGRHTYHDPARPWWSRRLRLDYVASDELKELVREINSHYRLPPPPSLPDAITIKYGYWRSTTFDDHGVHHAIRGQPREYLWSQVSRIRITRLEPLRRDFEKLQIFLPEEELLLRYVSHQGGRSATWRGATAEVIVEFLQQHVSSDRVDVDLHGERPSRQGDVHQMLAHAQKQIWELNWCLGICSALLVLALFLLAIDWGVWKAVFMAAVYGIIFGSAFWSIMRHHHQQVLRMEGWLSTFDTAAWNACASEPKGEQYA